LRSTLRPTLLAAITLALFALTSQPACAAKKKPAASAASKTDFSQREDVRAFIADMVTRHGFVESELRTLFSRATHYRTIIELVTPPTHARASSAG